MAIRKSGSSGIPFGENAGRPQSPLFGQPFFNGEASRLELYTTATGWQNIIQETPAVVSITGIYAEGNASNAITINGTNFAVGAIAYAIGSDGVSIQADSTTIVSVVELTAVFSGLSIANEPYDIKVVNPSNLYGILYETLQIDNLPVFSTQSGTLGTYIEQSPMSVQISVTDTDSSNIVFSVSSGSLPGGLSINPSTGLISGTPVDIIPNTTYTFTVSAADSHNTATRNYSITINDRGPNWTTLSELPVFSKNIAYSTTLVAADDNSIASYSLLSGSLPSGLSLNSSTGVISGTPTETTNSLFTIRATDVGGNYADRQFSMSNSIPVWNQNNTIYYSGTSIQLSAIDDSQISPIFAVSSGTLPTGISLSSSGILSGTPTTSGSANITFSATDSSNGVAYKSVNIIYRTQPQGSTFSTSSLPPFYLVGDIVQFSYTGAAQTFSPVTIKTATLKAWGAGGSGYSGGVGGPGGYSQGTYTFSTTPIYVYVGQGGQAPNTSSFNGGGYGNIYSGSYSGGGGGGTDFRTVSGTWSDTSSLNSRFLVAGGGGGVGIYGGGTGGSGGGDSGTRGTGNGGYGGTQSSGGSAGGSTNAGSFGIGASYTQGGAGAGGGGGWYGGGAGWDGGGGGGSGYIGGVTSGSTTVGAGASGTNNGVGSNGSAQIVVLSLV